jgi:hypothetical protein
MPNTLGQLERTITADDRARKDEKLRSLMIGDNFSGM